MTVAIFQELFSKLGGSESLDEPSDRLHVLSLSCVFPNGDDPEYGIFVRSRLLALARLAEVRVIAPVPLFDWGRRVLRSRKTIPVMRKDEHLEIHHPRWLYPPLGGGLNTLFLFLRLVFPILRLRSKWRFDLIDAHFAFPDGIVAAMLSIVTGVPFSITLRGNETMHTKPRFRRLLIGWALRRAAKIIPVSESLGRFAMDMGVSTKCLRVIPNGIHTGLFYPHNREGCRRKYGLQPDEKLILSAGSLIERKGHHHIIEAIQGLPDSVRLYIAGGPGREGNFETQIGSLIASVGQQGRVRMLGAVSASEMAELMNAADVLCLSSSREGWPNVVHEAMACGTPVVATSVGGVPEMIAGQRYGLVVPVNDKRALAEALRKALSHNWDRGEISKWAHSRPWEKVAREVLLELQEIQKP